MSFVICRGDDVPGREKALPAGEGRQEVLRPNGRAGEMNYLNTFVMKVNYI